MRKGKIWRDMLRVFRHKRKRRLSDKRKHIVKIRDFYRCRYCGRYTTLGHVDHVVPLSWGGSDSLSNLAWSCEACNLRKGARYWKPRRLGFLAKSFGVILQLWYNDYPSINDYI